MWSLDVSAFTADMPVQIVHLTKNTVVECDLSSTSRIALLQWCIHVNKMHGLHVNRGWRLFILLKQDGAAQCRTDVRCHKYALHWFRDVAQPVSLN